MKDIRYLVVLDFDGFLINSYGLLQSTFEHLGLDVGDENRFKHRRKFLKYLGGGKEFLGNLVSLSLPKKKKIREQLTHEYINNGRIYPEFNEIINDLTQDRRFQIGVISRNFTYNPGPTIRTVLRNSGVDEKHLDFLIPIPAGAKKTPILKGMRSIKHEQQLFGADEIGDFKSARAAGFDNIFMASYGFDNKKRLTKDGGIPADLIYDTPGSLAESFKEKIQGLK